MPRERIAAEAGSVEIAWQRDGASIEVATTVIGGVGRILSILTDAGLKIVDTATGDLPGTAQLDKVAGLLNGWHVHLHDRRDVNQLIRVLRSARGDAHGKDE